MSNRGHQGSRAVDNTLIITTYNRPDALETALESVCRQVCRPCETIVVDDGSDRRTADVVAQFVGEIGRLTHVWQPDDGFRAGRMRNLGITLARGAYLLFVDGDMVLHPQFVKDHLTHRKANRFIQGIRVPLSQSATREFLRNPFPVRVKHLENVGKGKYLVRSPMLSRIFNQHFDDQVKRIHSCNQSFWKSDLLRVNGFDERCNGFGGEDIDLCQRITSIGVSQFRLRFLALAYHLYHHSDANWDDSVQLQHTSHLAELGLDQYFEPAGLPADVVVNGRHSVDDAKLQPAGAAA